MWPSIQLIVLGDSTRPRRPCEPKRSDAIGNNYSGDFSAGGDGFLTISSRIVNGGESRRMRRDIGRACVYASNWSTSTRANRSKPPTRGAGTKWKRAQFVQRLASHNIHRVRSRNDRQWASRRDMLLPHPPRVLRPRRYAETCECAIADGSGNAIFGRN
jgi:hypothetical protein